ncbi:fibrinogen like 1B isoform X2 [Denticeps clupeoides]|uniref:fibrinogen like 1B isoform X2 n=1 Tax=Denticeps clupeoides TaxID=299321 RepID=UPI0010A338BB|nr:fibrinogen-like protein 1 isoform X2 [Denticeps clupeoides]
MSLVVMLVLVFQTANSELNITAEADDEECLKELSELRLNVQRLDDQLLLVDWELQNLQSHRHFPAHKPSNRLEPGVTSVLPGPGSLLVHDQDCSTLYDRLKPPSGFYRIKPMSSLEPFLVFCDMEDGGGWTVIQQRRNGKVDFNRDWVNYKEGFGHFEHRNDEFWLGNDHIHSLLQEGSYLVKIDLMDWAGAKIHALYENFRVANEKGKYRLHFGLYSGRAGDALSGGSNMVEQWSASHSGMQFSTRDQDNDRYLQGSCAKENKGGWWYNRCHAANLNGRFYRGGTYKAKHDNGVVWSTWRGLWYSLRHTTMKVRPQLFLDSLGSGDGPYG